MSRRSRRGGHSPVELQFSVKYAMPKGGPRRRMTTAVLEEAVKYWIEEGDNPDGFEITPIAWIHGNKTREAESEEDFRAVLGRLLQGRGAVHFTIRSHEGI